MKIMKIGGSSLESPKQLQQALELIRNEARPDQAVIVVSAFGGVTDKLIAMSRTAAGNDAAYKNQLKALVDFHHGIIQKLVDPQIAEKVMQKIVPVFDELTDLSSSRSFPPRLRILFFPPENASLPLLSPKC